MSIIVDEKTAAIVQGFTGRIGSFHAQEMIDYGTNVVGGVTPGKGGEKHLQKPVFDTVKDAVRDTGAEASIVFVPPPFAADAIMEAADAGIRNCICITDGIPAQDMMRVKRYMRRYKAQKRMTLTGPNCAGTISPGKAMLGIMPGHIYIQGNVGIIGRSGTLGYEAASQMKQVGIGVSTSVGIGGDPINGSSFKDHLASFEQDPETHAVVIIGEIGGPQEAEAAAFARLRRLLREPYDLECNRAAHGHAHAHQAILVSISQTDGAVGDPGFRMAVVEQWIRPGDADVAADPENVFLLRQ